MTAPPGRRELMATAVALLAAAAVGAALELLALQAPGSPLHLSLLPGPFGVLRALALSLSLLCFCSEVLAPRTGGDHPRWAVRAVSVGALLAVAVQTYGALSGMYVLQVKDLRADALPLFLIKHAGLVAFGVGYGAICARALRRPPT